MRKKLNKFGRRRKTCRRVPVDSRNERQGLEKMTEDERTQAQRRLESRLREMDSQRLSRISGRSRAEKMFFLGLMIFVVSILIAAAMTD